MPMRLIHITTVAHSLSFLRGQPEFFAERGFEIQAITSPGPLVDTMSGELGIEVHPVEMPRKITPFRDLAALMKMGRLLERLQPDIVHAHTPKGGLLGMIAATAARVPTRFYHMRGLPMETATGWKRTLLRTTETISCGLSHRTVAVGHSLRDRAIEEDICAPGDIVVLADGSGQGVDAEARFNPERFDEGHGREVRRSLGIPPESQVIGFVGRLVSDKGINELSEAWRRIRDAYPNAHLVAIGPFEERDPVPESTRRVLDGDPRVHLLGFRDDVASLYTALDIVTLPSHREGFPNVPLEAQAMELPVVVSDIPPCEEAIKAGRTGLCFAVGDARGLTDALQTYLDDPELRKEHGEAGRRRILKQFLPRRIWKDLYEEYMRMLDGRG